jgi:hypothetical protein
MSRTTLLDCRFEFSVKLGSRAKILKNNILITEIICDSQLFHLKTKKYQVQLVRKLVEASITI